jgi:DNA-binding beta-propeller fold protein YncE
MRTSPVLAAVFALAPWGCNIENEGIDPPADELIFPVGLAMDPGGRTLYVANANFDLKYNGGTVVAINLEDVESHQGEANVRAGDVIEAGSTVRIGTFASDLVLSPDGSRLFTPVRGDNSVTWIDVEEGGGRRLRCWDGSARGAAPPCTGDHVIGTGLNALGLRLPSEPYGIAFHDSYAIVTHAGVGEVSLIADVPGRPELVDIQADLPAAASGIGVHPVTGRVYVAHRGANALSTLDVFDGSTLDAIDAENRPVLVPRRSVPVDAIVSGADSRALAFHPDGREVYLTNRAPRSLVILDTAIGADGAPVDEWIDAIPLGQGPSRLVVHEEADGRVLAYVVCFDDALVYVIDPDSRRVDGILWTGEGPHAVAFDDARRWIFVATFVTSTIEVYDGDPASDSYRQLLFTIGVPKHPQGVDA